MFTRFKLMKIGTVYSALKLLNRHPAGLAPKELLLKYVQTVDFRSGWSSHPRKKERVLMDPSCKIAIITGGSRGIGLAAAYQLLCEGADHVVISDVCVEEGCEAVEQLNCKFGKDKASFFKCNVANPCEFEELFKETIRCHEQVDILFNNAAILADCKWSETVDINVKGVLVGCFLAFKYMGKDCGGCGGLVINNASIVGLQTLAGAPVYCSTKHAVIGITRTFGADFHFCRTCVRVISLCPGVTITDMVTGAIDRQYNPEWGHEAARELESLPKQEIGVTGKAVTWITRHGCSAQHYIIEGCKLYHAPIPERQCYMMCKAKFT